jgi:alkylation response protein AidB-like acyl-CoA dehydrogenase
MLHTLAGPAAGSYRDRLREWLETAIPLQWRQRDEHPLTIDAEHELRRHWGRRLFAAGYAGLTWPREFGGQGLGPIEEFILYDELARADAPESLDTIGKYLAGPAIIHRGSDAQREKYLRKILSGDEIWCEGYSEPGAGSDLAAASTVAKPIEGGYRITGRKIWTSFAAVADRCYLLAKTSPTLPRRHNLSVLLLDMHQPSVQVRPIKQISGAAYFNEVVFDGARVEAADRLGPENAGWELVGMTGPFRRVRFVRDGLRHYSELRDLAARFRECAQQHCPADGSVARADRFVERVELYRWHLMRLTELQANERDWFGPASVIRYTGTELSQQITEAGLALACPRDGAYWRLRYLDRRSATISGGSVQIQRNVVSTAVLKLPRPPRPQSAGRPS